MTIVKIDVPSYSPERGLQTKWEEDAQISVEVDGNVVYIAANREGLVSLARLVLTLAESTVPSGSHWHLDETNGLQEGATEMILERL